MDSKATSLSSNQARKIILLSQGLQTKNNYGKGVEATLSAIQQLGYIQIDTISVVERAHHHTLWNRSNGYSLSHINELQEQGKIFEYWSHAAAYLPMEDYRYSLPRKNAYANGEKHWRKKDVNICKQVIKRITEEGPLQARDFDHNKKPGENGWWQWKPAKVALEQLFMEGELMVAKRKGFQKVYDLCERVIPDSIDSSMPTESEYHQHLIRRYLGANGIGTATQISYLRKGLKVSIVQECFDMCERGELILVEVKGQSYYALANIDELLKKSLSLNKVKILSPFDNLLIQRKRTKELFDFDYQIECYVPAAKRKYGYFSLPLLWGNTFAGRMDAKIDRKTGILNIINLHLETLEVEKFNAVLKLELIKFLKFNQGETVHLQYVSNSSISNFNKEIKNIAEILCV